MASCWIIEHRSKDKPGSRWRPWTLADSARDAEYDVGYWGRLPDYRNKYEFRARSYVRVEK